VAKKAEAKAAKATKAIKTERVRLALTPKMARKLKQMQKQHNVAHVTDVIHGVLEGKIRVE
jgi:hypothetical protein